MADPVSWKVVERGWRVLAGDGSDLGSVDEVVGDSTADIFNGLVVSPGLLRGNRYVPSEQVAEIREAEVQLALDSAAFEALEEWHGPPPSPHILRPDRR